MPSIDDYTDAVGDYTLDTAADLEPSLALMMDACADIDVVTRGSAIACGVKLDPILQIVDENNLLKIATGHKNPDTGKFEKASDHPDPAPLIAAEIERQIQDAADTARLADSLHAASNV